MKFAKLLLMAISLAFIGCVGAIKEEQKEVQANTTKTPTFTFGGIHKIEPISDTKLAVYFNPALALSGETSSGGGQGATSVNFIYEIVKDGATIPVATFINTNIAVNGEGYYVVEIETEGRGSCATYNIIATRADDLTKISSKNYYRECSLDEFYPKFNGIFAAKALPGCDLYSGARVEWKVAEMADELKDEVQRYQDLKVENLNAFVNGDIDLTTFNTNNDAYDDEIDGLKEYAPDSYSLYYAETEDALVAKLGNPATTPNAIITDANDTSFDVTGLTAGREYFFAVRSSTALITSSSKKNLELNVNIRSYTVPEVEPVVFDGATTVDIPKDLTGYNEAIVRFNECQGCNKYYFYVHETPTVIDVMNDTPNFQVDLESSPAINKYTVTGLQKHKQYYFYAVAVKSCGGAGITDYKGDNTFQFGTTTPDIAPFNGANTLNPIGGALDRLELSWDLPDTSNGVYDYYNIYRTDEGGTVLQQLSNTPYPDDPYVESSDDLNNPLTNSITIRNLPAGEDAANPIKYCFVVSPKESDSNGPLGIGREMPAVNRKVICRDFHYQAPTFAGPTGGSCNSTASSFTVNFPVPADGTYSEFRLYYKKDGGESLIDYDAAEADTTTVVDDRGVGAAYTRVVFRYDPLATPKVAKPAYVTDSDATTIPFVVTGLEPSTIYNFAMETYYDPDGPGLAAPFYVRPAIMRTCTTSKPEVVHEGWDHIFAVGNKTNGLDGDSVIKESFAPETLNKFNYFMTGNGTDLEPLDRYHLIEDPAAPESAGLVHLSWFDFKFSSLGTYANSAADGTNLYYVVERSPNPDMSGAIDIGTPIAVENGIYLYHFVDNKVPAAGVKYYYRVKLRMDFVDLLFSSFDPVEAAINNSNAILEVMIPPPNMAFIHRYMFNKHQCTRMNKTIWHGKHLYPDIEYSAPNRNRNFDVMTGYNLRGARGSLYQDVTNKNYDITNNYRCLYNGMGSTYDSIADDYFFDIGRSFMVDRFEVGYKIGLVGTNPCDQSGTVGGPMNCLSENTNGRGVADKDTVWLRLHQYRYSDAQINVSAAGIPSNSWQAIEGGISEAQFRAKTDLIFSNSAYLPPANLQRQSNAKIVCEERSINIAGVDYDGRLGSRQEYIVFGGWNESLSATDHLQIGFRMNFGMNDELHNACNSTPYGTRRVPFQPDEYNIDISKNYYPTRNNAARNDLHLLRSGSYSDGSDHTNLHSSHLCMSKFGLQDAVGNAAEFTEDWFYHTGVGIRLDVTKTPEWAKKYWLNTARAPAPPLLPAQDDYYGNHMASMDGGSENIIYTSRIGGEREHFWNPLMGVIFNCSDTAWGVVDCWDDKSTNLQALKDAPDSSNYQFSSNQRDKNNGYMNFPMEGSPDVLADLATENGNIPFNYEYVNSYVKLNNQTTPYPMIVGGAGYDRGDGDVIVRNPDTDWTGTRGALYGAGYTRVDASYGHAGIRCVFPIE